MLWLRRELYYVNKKELPMVDGLSRFEGLTEEEAARRLAKDGPNELPTAKKRGPFRIALEIVREPMFLLLIACGSLYLILGDIKEALLLLAFVFVVVGITYFQERKTERALDALRDLSSPRALVIRSGEKKRIAGRDVVAGDLLVLSEGDRAPADSILISSAGISIDESLITGESVPVSKTPTTTRVEMERPGGDGTPFLYSGTLVVQGQGIAEVKATGSQTELGKIGRSLQTLEIENTSLQRQTGRLVKLFASIGFGMCLVVALTFGLARGDWLKGILAGLTLGMAMLPEEFPVILTIFLALGAWRLSKHNVLTRRIPAVETLGATTALCVDKTGTLTLNQMSVVDVCVDGEIFKIDDKQSSLPEKFHAIVEFSILASPADPFDPMEKAMQELGIRTLANTEHLHSGWELQREYPLSRELLSMSRVWQSPDQSEFIIAAKGAPEAIADLCHLSVGDRTELTKQIAALASSGRRVLGVARSTFQKIERLPEIQHDFNFEFLGLLGLSDPVRPGVPEAITECGNAGIRVIMITGDYPGTAQSIAREIGIPNSSEIITGSELEMMSDEDLSNRVRTVNLFARMIPEQKLRLVQALKANGEVVAMTGDGVNDAPALKAAHIGVAMGKRGTDVAREAGSIVLLDDAFESIVEGVRTGRRIFSNLKKAMLYVFVVHVPIAGLSLLPVLFGWPLMLLPIHIVFLELIIDPACTVVFESEKEDMNVMRRPPRLLNESLFGMRNLLMGLIQGGGVLAVALLVAHWTLSSFGEQTARASAFTIMVFCNLGLILLSRAGRRSLIETLRTPNKPQIWVTLGSLALLCLALFSPWVQKLFMFESLSPSVLGISFLAVVFSFIVSNFIRRWVKN